MAQLIVRNLEEEIKMKLKQRAQRNGRSVEDEVRHILRSAARLPKRSTKGLGSRIAARFAKIGLRDDLPELRGQAPVPFDFSR
jgi:plasmid stability protein